MAYVIPAPQTHRRWPLALLACVLLAAGALFSDSLRSMWSVWRSSESFAHGPLIPLATIWLAWQRRRELATIPVAPWWPAALAVAASGFGWLLGNLAGVNTLEQLAVVSMVPGLVALVLGWRFAWAIAFPLLFLFFAVPFGTQMLPMLMDWTADFTVFAVQLSGIPVFREGTSFTLPSGRWSVVESCSGIRYLLAAVPLAFLYSYLSYRSYWARVKFIALTIVVALVANWVRAYIIVMLGHVSNMRVAVGADHLVYGWVFFGIVMGITFWLGNYIGDGAAVASRDAATPADSAANAGPRAVSPTPAGPVLAAAGVALVLLAALTQAPNTLHAARAPGLDIARLVPLLDPLAPAAVPERSYQPLYHGASDTVLGRSKADPSVGVMVLRYQNQDRTAEMIHEGNRIMPGKPDEPTWQVRSRAVVRPSELGSGFPAGAVNEYVIAGPDGLHLVWEWFQVQGETLSSPARVKAATALAMLRGKGDESLAWFVWTPLQGPVDAARMRVAAQASQLGQVPILAGR